MENEIIIPNEQDTRPIDVHLDLKLEGWPLTTGIIAVCVTGVALYSIYAFTGKALPLPRVA